MSRHLMAYFALKKGEKFVLRYGDCGGAVVDTGGIV